VAASPALRAQGPKCILDGNYPDAGGKCAACPPVLCELYCANGFDTDKDGCQICKVQAANHERLLAERLRTRQVTFCWTGYMCIPNGAMC
jgi:hypothetical protein